MLRDGRLASPRPGGLSGRDKAHGSPPVPTPGGDGGIRALVGRTAPRGIRGDWRRCGRGQATVEYALLLGTIALVLVVGLLALKVAIGTDYSSLTASLTALLGGPGGPECWHAAAPAHPPPCIR